MKASPAARVAAGATAVIAVVYVIGVVVFNLLFASHQTAQSDYYLGTRLTAAAGYPAMLGQNAAAAGSSATSGDVDADAAPVFLWLVNATGTVTAHSTGAPELPPGQMVVVLLGQVRGDQHVEDDHADDVDDGDDRRRAGGDLGGRAGPHAGMIR